jgi:chromosome segregation ATPase
MKTLEYFNNLIEEHEKLKKLYKSSVDTVRLLRREVRKLNDIIEKRDKNIQKLENESLNLKMKTELDKVKSELKKMKNDYKDLEDKYNSIVIENDDLKQILNDAGNTSDSD